MTVFETVLVQPVDRVERITARARQMHFGRALLSLVALLLVGLGRLTFGVFAALWFVATWCAAAVAEGWNEARRTQLARRGTETGG